MRKTYLIYFIHLKSMQDVTRKPIKLSAKIKGSMKIFIYKDIFRKAYYPYKLTVMRLSRQLTIKIRRDFMEK